MPRPPRILIPGEPYHITQRGNQHQAVFFSDSDRYGFLRRLSEQASDHDMRILSYCLMTNHVHLVIVPGSAEGVSKALQTVFRDHSVIVNSIRKTSGHLWGARYRSCVMDRSHLYYAMRYVELNPVRAAMVEKPEDWRWSSARDHPRLQVGFCDLRDDEWRNRFDPYTWREWLSDPHQAVINDRLREATRLGRRFGDPEKSVSQRA